METIGGILVRRPDGLDDAVADLLGGENMCTVATHRPDGTIRARVVWVDTDGEHVLLNSVAGRAWVRDLERDATVNCSVVNLDNPYEFVSIEGTVVDVTRDGAEAHIDSLAMKYLRLAAYPFHDPAQPRVLLRVRPERVLHMAPASAELG